MNLINGIAEEMKEIKAKGGKIGIVGGPAIVHTGSGKYLASLIREGYIDVLMAGNALATHDIESNLFGTSLGIEVETGKIVAHGHTHHMRAINRINNSGSIRDAVEDGTPIFPNEPAITVKAKIIEAQLIETALLAAFNHGTLVTTAAKRITTAAKNIPVMEFGARRARGIDSAIDASSKVFSDAT